MYISGLVMYIPVTSAHIYRYAVQKSARGLKGIKETKKMKLKNRRG